MNTSKIILINSILFFIGWNGVMLLGADFPPPSGYIWMAILIAVLDYIQYKYLRSFLIELRRNKKKSFIDNTIFFLIGGVAISSLILIVRLNLMLSQPFVDWITFIIVVTLVGVIYGVLFWIFNYILVKYFAK
ncbi:hypothetical protein H8S20_17040 [Clostridium sp. NSJ-6]|uniref:Uncharacterized protein n=1 Tax=Clostridium hominis TaxID=2763036 RepID=A0ABR7DGK6_9CLOT|nr:hypothetical protein [Clostridium hominis]MBC5630565.1 hypothetical protein [Clostridium hominis]MDU2672123.1 hypothetical protein [Clostridium sp.]